MNFISVKYVRVNAKGGASLSYSISESMILSLQENRPVHLIHNERLFKIEPEELINFICKKAEQK